MAQALATLMLPSLSFFSNPISNSSKTSLSFRLPTAPPKIGSLSIRYARVAGIEIPDDKRLEYSLQSIYGIGRTNSRQILIDLNFDNKMTKDCSQEELTALRKGVSKYLIEGDLRRYTARAIKRLKDIRCYRGIRHIKCLPCRGQRTRNNCKTVKRQRVVVPRKKKVKK